MTTERKQAIAMYFAGAMAWHALTHAVLAAITTDEPHKTLGIPMTPARNAAAAVVWAGVSWRSCATGQGTRWSSLPRPGRDPRHERPSPRCADAARGWARRSASGQLSTAPV